MKTTHEKLFENGFDLCNRRGMWQYINSMAGRYYDTLFNSSYSEKRVIEHINKNCNFRNGALYDKQN